MLCTSPPPASPAISEISVGAPSPPPVIEHPTHNNHLHHNGEDYFRPLKRLKMVDLQQQQQQQVVQPVAAAIRERSSSPSRSSIEGVKSFSIADILGHEPQSNSTTSNNINNNNNNQRNNLNNNLNHNNQLLQQTKIVRPWDHLRGPVPVRPFLPPALLHYEHRLALDYQRQLQEHLTAQAQLLRHMSMDIIPSESGSDRSSSAASDCCSPEITNRSSSDHHSNHRSQQSPHSSSHHQQQQQKTKPNGTPLDALFQMTNKPFDETQGEHHSENRCIELHSPDGVHSCILRASDPQEALIWFNALHSAMGRTTQKALQDANRALATILGELKHIGWLSRRIGSDQNGRSSSESSDDTDRWQPLFVAVTDREFRLYESAPWSIEAWGRPVESCPLASTRLAGAGNSTTVNSNTVQSTVFCVRCGTPRGVISHWLRAETHRDMASWARALVQGSHNAVNFQREFSFRCLYQGRPSQLIVHLDRGFSLLEGIGPQTKTIWTFPFDKLKGSADDGHRILYLDFGGDEGEIEMDMECCPKPVVFVLHNCLSAKVHSLA